MMRAFVFLALIGACLMGTPAFSQPKPKYGALKGLSQDEVKQAIKPQVRLELMTDLTEFKVHNRTLNARWTKFPGPVALEKYYPKLAKKNNLRGSVLAVCDWDDKGAVSDCRVIEETPAEMGFGEATRKLLIAEGQIGPKTANEAFVAGTGIAVVLRWELY